MQVQSLIDELLVGATFDWVGIWELPKMAESAGKATTPEEKLVLSIQAIRRLLEDGFLEAGELGGKDGFLPWHTTPEESCRRIEREWQTFPGGPRLGDMSCWFNLTRKGTTLAKERRLGAWSGAMWRARIRWLKPEEGGRQSHPPGPGYSARYKGLGAQDHLQEAIGVVLDISAPADAEGIMVADIRSRAEDPPIQLVSPGSRFELYEGPNCVARGEVLRYWESVLGR